MRHIVVEVIYAISFARLLGSAGILGEGVFVEISGGELILINTIIIVSNTANA